MLSTLWINIRLLLEFSKKPALTKNQTLYPARKELRDICERLGLPMSYRVVEIDHHFNAFAWVDPQHGATIAVGRPLIVHVDSSALGSIIAHEIAHIYYKDTFTKLSIRILNAAVVFGVGILSTLLLGWYGVLITALLFVLGFLGVRWVEREMEYRADRFAASFVPVDDLLRVLSSTDQKASASSWLIKLVSSHPTHFDRRARLFRRIWR
jgi:Zn-dependent protease with chaperone function